MPASSGKLADVRFIGPVIGRYTLESRARLPGVQIFALRLQSISPQLMVASAPVVGSIDEPVTAHFIPFGNVRGRVARHIDGGFCIDIELDAEEKRKLAARIEWYKKRTFSGITDKREHRRFLPREPKSAVVLHNGTVLPCLVIDLSASGAAISADYEPAIGEPLAVGKVVARVVRKLEVGFAVQFIASQEKDGIEELLRAPNEWEDAVRAANGDALFHQAMIA
ncbi:MAG: PilZ domain-containing protein [Devosia sp.]